MALQADKTKDQRDAAYIAAQARALFEEWAAEEKAGYKGRSHGRSSSRRSTPGGHLTAGPSGSPLGRWVV